jgi:hypothetical protein
LGDKSKEVQLSALKIFSTITNSSTTLLYSSSFLTKLCTFLMLEGQEKVSSTEILSGLVKNSVVRLATGLDLGLMVALVDRDNFFLMATVMLQAIERKKQLEEQVLALKFAEVCLGDQNQLSHADLFESLMSPDFTSSMVSFFFYLLAPVMRCSAPSPCP